MTGPIGGCTIEDVERVLQVETRFGQVLLGDPAIRRTLSGDLAHWIEVLFDPYGESQLTSDFDEPWDAVTARASQEMARAQVHRLAMLRTPGGNLTVRLQDHALDATLQARVAHTASTHVTVAGGTLTVGDAFESWDSLPVVAMAAGEYRADVHTLRVPSDRSQIVGVLGDAANPAVVVVLEPTDGAAPELTLVECRDESWPTKPAPQRLCRAEIMKIEDSVAILRLKITKHIDSGYGRLAVSESTAMAPGTRLLVRLRDYTGAYWWCEPADTA